MCESIRPFVCLSCACSCIQMSDRTCMHSSMHAFMCLHARVREGICLNLSVCLSIYLSACMFVNPNVCSHMCAFFNACATFLISNFHVCTWVFASVRTCVHMSIRLWMHGNTRTHALMNARVYDQTFGCINMHADRQTDGQRDELTHTSSCTRTFTHTNTSLLTYTHDALRYIRMDG